MIFNIFGKELQVGRRMIIAVLSLIIAATGLAGYFIVQGNRDIIIEKENNVSNYENTIQNSSSISEKDNTNNQNTEKEPEEIRVYVVGCVNKQGIVTLKKGDMIDDAIRLAGGATKDADINNINLVYILEENVMLHIKSKSEAQIESQKSDSNTVAGKGVLIEKNSGGAVVNEVDQQSGTKGKININKASISELDTLPGIGEATAQDIISYREENGSFKSTQDIMKVPRIKESRFSKIKDYISIN